MIEAGKRAPIRSCSREGARLLGGLVVLLGGMVSGISGAQVAGIPADEHLTAPKAASQDWPHLLAQVSAARRELENHPSAEANLALGTALAAIGETEAASQFLDRAMDLNPKLAEAWFEKGLIVSARGDWSAAADLFRHAIRLAPDYAPAHLALGEMLLRMGDFDAARSELTRVLAIDKNDAGAHQGLGLIDLQEGKAEAAEEEFRRALQVRTGYSDAENGLARALAVQHKWNEAAPILERLATAHPDSSETASSLATALANLGDRSGAAKEFSRARELSEQELVLLRAKGESNWGIALRNEGKLEEAAAAFRRAASEDPSYCDAHDDLGEVLWLEKDFATAMSEFQAAVHCRPDSAMAHNNLGIALLYYQHDVDAAIEQLRAALAARPGFSLAHLNLGKALAGKQDFAGAEAELRNAIAIDPASAGAHLELGVVLATKGGSVSQEAQSEMKKGLELDPKLRDLIPKPYLAYLQ